MNAPLPASDETPPPLLFDAVLRPHRSLSGTGFVVLMACVAGISFASGIVFLLLGAWPVFGFFGLDVALIWLAFRLNYRAARLVERVRLSENCLEIERIHPSGRSRSWRFQPYWVQVILEHRGEHHSRLALRSHGRELTFGSFLTPDERESLSQALARALAACRHEPHPAA